MIHIPVAPPKGSSSRLLLKPCPPKGSSSRLLLKPSILIMQHPKIERHAGRREGEWAHGVRRRVGMVSGGSGAYQLLFLAAGLGVKTLVSTALGMTETCCGGMLARSTVFSLDVCDTHITWLVMLHVKFSTCIPPLRC